MNYSERNATIRLSGRVLYPEKMQPDDVTRWRAAGVAVNLDVTKE